MTLATGQSLSFYEILGPLGAGAMGEVYRAKDTRLEREVALKVLPAEFAEDPERMARFEREAKVLAALQHPNIVTVHSVEHVDGIHFLTMELVEGATLGASSVRGGMSLERFYPLGSALADAVHAAHKKGVTHRDLKPDNVILDSAGRPTVLDFGLAKIEKDIREEGPLASSLTDAGRVMGTIPYMAPEALKGERVDSRADVFSLGVILFEVLTGKHPFPGEDPGECMSAILRDPPPRADELRPDVPRELARLLGRCLAKDPDRRLQTALDLRNELEELAASGGEAASAVAAPPARRSWLAPAVLAAVLLVAAGAWIARWMGSDDPERAAFSSTPLTSSQFHDQDPTWSPEGEWIAFSRQTAGSHDLYLKNVSSGDEILRRGGPGDELAPRWSPDGRYIAIVSTDLPGTPVVLVPPHSTGTSGERVLVDTQMRVFDIGSQQGAMGGRPWAEDGSSLLVSRVTDGGRIAVFRVGRDDRERTQLTFPPVGSDDLAASYSFDQENIVFMRRTETGGRLMLMLAAGGEPEVLLDDGLFAEHPSWRPDGRHVVYTSNQGNMYADLWEIDVETRTSRQLTFLTDVFGGLSISADDRIAYPREWHNTILTTLELEGGRTEALTKHSADNYGPRFSPDGREIAYHSTRTGNSEIWVRAQDGDERRITHGAGTNVFPDWSPDGDRLIFSSDRDGAFKIYTSDPYGGDCHLLWNRAVSHTESIRWSPKSATGELIGCIVSEEGGNVLWGVPPDRAGEARPLFDGVAGFDWYMDSRRVICTLDEGRAEKLVAVHLETGEMRTLWTGPHSDLDVSPDGRSVMFCAGLGHLGMGLATLELVPPEDPDGLPTAPGEPVDIVRPDGAWHVHHGGWAPDSKSVVYVYDADRATLHELVERR